MTIAKHVYDKYYDAEEQRKEQRPTRSKSDRSGLVSFKTEGVSRFNSFRPAKSSFLSFDDKIKETPESHNIEFFLDDKYVFASHPFFIIPDGNDYIKCPEVFANSQRQFANTDRVIQVPKDTKVSEKYEDSLTDFGDGLRRVTIRKVDADHKNLQDATVIVSDEDIIDIPLIKRYTNTMMFDLPRSKQGSQQRSKVIGLPLPSLPFLGSDDAKEWIYPVEVTIECISDHVHDIGTSERSAKTKSFVSRLGYSAVSGIFKDVCRTEKYGDINCNGLKQALELADAKEKHASGDLAHRDKEDVDPYKQLVLIRKAFSQVLPQFQHKTNLDKFLMAVEKAGYDDRADLLKTTDDCGIDQPDITHADFRPTTVYGDESVHSHESQVKNQVNADYFASWRLECDFAHTNQAVFETGRLETIPDPQFEHLKSNRLIRSIAECGTTRTRPLERYSELNNPEFTYLVDQEARFVNELQGDETTDYPVTWALENYKNADVLLFLLENKASVSQLWPSPDEFENHRVLIARWLQDIEREKNAIHEQQQMNGVVNVDYLENKLAAIENRERLIQVHDGYKTQIEEIEELLNDLEYYSRWTANTSRKSEYALQSAPHQPRESFDEVDDHRRGSVVEPEVRDRRSTSSSLLLQPLQPVATFVNKLVGVGSSSQTSSEGWQQILMPNQERKVGRITKLPNGQYEIEFAPESVPISDDMELFFHHEHHIFQSMLELRKKIKEELQEIMALWDGFKKQRLFEVHDENKLYLVSFGEVYCIPPPDSDSFKPSASTEWYFNMKIQLPLQETAAEIDLKSNTILKIIEDQCHDLSDKAEAAALTREMSSSQNFNPYRQLKDILSKFACAIRSFDNESDLKQFLSSMQNLRGQGPSAEDFHRKQSALSYDFRIDTELKKKKGFKFFRESNAHGTSAIPTWRLEHYFSPGLTTSLSVDEEAFLCLRQYSAPRKPSPVKKAVNRLSRQRSMFIDDDVRQETGTVFQFRKEHIPKPTNFKSETLKVCWQQDSEMGNRIHRGVITVREDSKYPQHASFQWESYDGVQESIPEAFDGGSFSSKKNINNIVKEVFIEKARPTETRRRPSDSWGTFFAEIRGGFSPVATKPYEALNLESKVYKFGKNWFYRIRFPDRSTTGWLTYGNIQDAFDVVNSLFRFDKDQKRALAFAAQDDNTPNIPTSSHDAIIRGVEIQLMLNELVSAEEITNQVSALQFAFDVMLCERQPQPQGVEPLDRPVELAKPQIKFLTHQKVLKALTSRGKILKKQLPRRKPRSSRLKSHSTFQGSSDLYRRSTSNFSDPGFSLMSYKTSPSTRSLRRSSLSSDSSSSTSPLPSPSSPSSSSSSRLLRKKSSSSSVQSRSSSMESFASMGSLPIPGDLKGFATMDGNNCLISTMKQFLDDKFFYAQDDIDELHDNKCARIRISGIDEFINKRSQLESCSEVEKAMHNTSWQKLAFIELNQQYVEFILEELGWPFAEPVEIWLWHEQQHNPWVEEMVAAEPASIVYVRQRAGGEPIPIDRDHLPTKQWHLWNDGAHFVPMTEEFTKDPVVNQYLLMHMKQIRSNCEFEQTADFGVSAVFGFRKYRLVNDGDRIKFTPPACIPAHLDLSSFPTSLPGVQTDETDRSISMWGKVVEKTQCDHGANESVRGDMSYLHEGEEHICILLDDITKSVPVAMVEPYGYIISEAKRLVSDGETKSEVVIQHLEADGLTLSRAARVDVQTIVKASSAYGIPVNDILRGRLACRLLPKVDANHYAFELVEQDNGFDSKQLTKKLTTTYAELHGLYKQIKYKDPAFTFNFFAKPLQSKMDDFVSGLSSSGRRGSTISQGGSDTERHLHEFMELIVNQLNGRMQAENFPICLPEENNRLQDEFASFTHFEHWVLSSLSSSPGEVTLVFIRHGHFLHNDSKLVDPPLSEQGYEDAVVLANALSLKAAAQLHDTTSSLLTDIESDKARFVTSNLNRDISTMMIALRPFIHPGEQAEESIVHKQGTVYINSLLQANSEEPQAKSSLKEGKRPTAPKRVLDMH